MPEEPLGAPIHPDSVLKSFMATFPSGPRTPKTAIVQLRGGLSAGGLTPLFAGDGTNKSLWGDGFFAVTAESPQWGGVELALGGWRLDLTNGSPLPQGTLTL